MACNKGIEIVTTEDICKGETVNTKCVVHSTAIPTLGLPPNSRESEIITALVVALASNRSLIADLELRVTNLETPVV